MDWSKIICIEIKKYNNQQLEVIETQLGAIPDILKWIKSEGTQRIWLEEGVGVVAYLEKKELWDKYDTPLYKGLLVVEKYSPLSKREKDRLLKMKPVEFNTKKNSIKVSKVEAIKVVETVEVIENQDYNVDDILDKISQCGIKSLTKGEKQFLDNLSNQ